MKLPWKHDLHPTSRPTQLTNSPLNLPPDMDKYGYVISYIYIYIYTHIYTYVNPHRCTWNMLPCISNQSTDVHVPARRGIDIALWAQGSSGVGGTWIRCLRSHRQTVVGHRARELSLVAIRPCNPKPAPGPWLLSGRAAKRWRQPLDVLGGGLEILLPVLIRPHIANHTGSGAAVARTVGSREVDSRAHAWSIRWFWKLSDKCQQPAGDSSA